MRTKRLLTLVAMTVMALAITAAVACGSETQPAAVDSDGQTVGHTITTVELDGAFDNKTGGTRTAAAEVLFVEGESHDVVDPDGSAVIHELPGIESDIADIDDDATSILPQREVKDGSGLVNAGFPNPNNLVEPDTCENVLGPAPAEYELGIRSATDTASAGNLTINTMCLAGYDSEANENGLTVVLVTMNNHEAAAAHYEVIQAEFSSIGVDFFEQRNLDDDVLSATVDQGGMGSIVVLRIGPNFVQVHTTPSNVESPWPIEVMLELAHSVLERLPIS